MPKETARLVHLLIQSIQFHIEASMYLDNSRCPKRRLDLSTYSFNQFNFISKLQCIWITRGAQRDGSTCPSIHPINSIPIEASMYLDNSISKLQCIWITRGVQRDSSTCPPTYPINSISYRNFNDHG